VGDSIRVVGFRFSGEINDADDPEIRGCGIVGSRLSIDIESARSNCAK